MIPIPIKKGKNTEGEILLVLGMIVCNVIGAIVGNELAWRLGWGRWRWEVR